MEKFFNTAGPVRANMHYCLPPLSRVDLPQILRLIAQQKYFILHAPRQTGKTSLLLGLMDYLNEQSQYRALYCNVEAAQASRENIKEALWTIVGDIALRARNYLGDAYLHEHMPDLVANTSPSNLLLQALNNWAIANPKPLVLMIDEIDSLVGDTLISVLRQLRSGYNQRPDYFPHSIILCGVRDVRDYRIHSSAEKSIITGGSAFNIKAESLRLGGFIEADLVELYQQHTAETGQPFTEEALQRAWQLTQGQPWLVNALAYEVTSKQELAGSRTQPITATMLDTAKERLIARRETHLDQLVDKLQEPRVQRVIEPMVRGINLSEQVKQDDIQYVLDLGLISRTTHGLQIANPIYQEVIPRELSYVVQINLESHFQASWYIGPDGRLEMDKLLTEFQTFFREHSEHWVGRFDYKEAGAQLLLQAFLQRIINGGGRIEREYGLGRGRTDLLVVWPYGAAQVQRVAIEVKLLYSNLQKTITDGLAQTWGYMDRANTTDGHLVIFDRRATRSWADKIFRQEMPHHGQTIVVWGM